MLPIIDKAENVEKPNFQSLVKSTIVFDDDKKKYLRYHRGHQWADCLALISNCMCTENNNLKAKYFFNCVNHDKINIVFNKERTINH